MENNQLSLNILAERENKRNFIKNNIDQYQIITLKANIPGSNKKLKISYLLVRIFEKILDNKLNKNIIKKEYFDGFDGPCIIYLINHQSKCLKDAMVELEENHELGRFVDIDVYYQNPTSQTRGVLRKCYLCDLPAYVCGRNKTHTYQELIDYITKKTYHYVGDLIIKYTEDAMLQELNLDPKFGLVTPTSNGSHSDMNYQMMKDSIEVIKQDMPLYFLMGFNDLDDYTLLSNLRILGKTTEQKMLEVTNNINTYKGFIFCGGIISACIGKWVSLPLDNQKSIFDLCQKLCKGITNELKNSNQINTFGIEAFKKYQITGARGAAEAGYPIIQELLNNNKYSKLETLIYLISKCDDTILLKRCGSIEKYFEVKNIFKTYLETKNINLDDLNNYCLNNHLSFGGSADMLILYELILNYQLIFNI